MSKCIKWVQIALMIVLPLNLMWAAFRYGGRNQKSQEQLGKFARVMGLVRRHYVDGDDDKIGYQNLVDGALDGMLRNLDKHSYYLKPEDFQRATERLKGEFGGIGITFTKKDDRYTVVEVLPEGPAGRAGVQREDQIFFVNAVPISGKEMKDVVKLIKGEKGTEVTLGIHRPATNEDMDLSVMREIIKTPTVRNVHYVRRGILYCQIRQFNQNTSRELLRVLKKQRKGMSGLVLDLRFNPGGLLVSAHEICSFFLSYFNANGGRRVVVSTVPRNQKLESHRFVEDTYKTSVPMVILVNGQSASAAEIVAGCMKDYRRATLVGEKTFGKGSVQDEIQLPVDRSAVRLTVAKYYTPSRAVIHGNGIEPDIEVKIPRKNQIAFYHQLTRLNPAKREGDVPDPQLEKAVEVVTQQRDTIRQHMKERR